MMLMALRFVATLLATGLLATAAASQPLSILYGPGAPSREGDVDHIERIFISVPEDLRERLYLRVFDPETAGEHDTPFGAWSDSTTAFRLFGGEGAFSAAPRPVPVEDGAAASGPETDALAPGRLIDEARFGSDPATDGRWVPLAAFTAAEGEVIDGRAHFRLDVVGEEGNDGNVFEVAVSLSPERADPPEGLRMFSWLPTLRWPARGAPSELRFTAPAGAELTLQDFDAAGGEITLVSTFGETRLPSSAQDVWGSSSFTAPEGRTAITLRGGSEAPNDVTLGLFDADGQPVALELPVRPAPAQPRPVALPVARPLADCTSVAFDATGSSGAGRLSYAWDFGDGAGTSEATFAHRYAAPGTYEAVLRVMEAGDDRIANGALARVPVLVRPAPLAVAGEPLTAAPGEPVVFDGSGSQASDQPIARHLWTFGDGATATGATAEHAYAEPGLYRAVLRVEDDAEHPCNFGLATRLVTVNFPPVAEAGDARTAAVGQPVPLSGAASYDVDGAILSHVWDLGDGTVLEGATISHAWTEPGTYVATLTVTDDSGVGNDTASDTVTIRVNAPPEPVITVEPARPIAVGEVARLDGSGSSDADGVILTHDWDFGDGATGSGETVDYAWVMPGVYRVQLTVTDDSATRSATSSTELEITVSDAPKADPGPAQHLTASVVSFDGGGSSDTDGVITSWEWEFGDGATASGRNVSHAYARPGTYEVALTVRDDSGAPLNVHRAATTVRINAAPIADAGPDLIGAPGQELILDGSGSVDPDGEIAEHLWRFEDGSEARGIRTARAFDTPGLHRVVLTVRDDSGHDAAFDVDEVLVRINAAPVAAAGADVLAEPGQPVRLDAGNSFDPDGQITTWRWDFDDLDAPIFEPAVERIFDTPGVRAAQLTVIDDSGTGNASASDELRIRINHPPVADAGPDIETDSLFVTFDGSASSDADGDTLAFTWDFGDGSAPAVGRVVTHSYPRSGIFPVSLTVDDGTGLGNATAVASMRVLINTPPVAVAGGNRDVCSGDTVLFDGSASLDPDGGLLRYAWDFGDGTHSELVNPGKIFPNPGVYETSLTVRDDSGMRTGRHTDRVAVVVHQAPTAVAGPDIRACTNQTVQFNGSRSTDADGAVDLFQWNFGDGSTGGGERPTKVYERPGDYRVVLTITGDALGSCSAVHSDELTVTVVDAPRLDIIGPGRVAAGAPATWRAALTGPTASEDARFEWGFGDGVTAEGREIEYRFEQAGLHVVTLRATLPEGGEDCDVVETRLNVIANAPPVPAIDAPERIAAGDLVLFDASASTDPDGALTGFGWDFGDGTRASGVQVRHRYAAPGSHSLRLTVTDDAGVSNSHVVEERTIIVTPAPAAGLAAAGQLCPGVPQPWAVSDAGGLATAWDIAGDPSSDDMIEHVFASPGIYPVAVTLDDGGGLANSRRTEEVFVRVNHPPIAAAGPDRLICPGDTVGFDGSGSRDPDGTITTWRWDFDDGIVLDGIEVSRSFDTAGTILARLSVTDDSASQCAIGQSTARVRVNAAPIADAGPDRDVPVGAAHDWVIFDAGGSHDPDGDGLIFRWDFGDGTTASGALVRHRYAELGDYEVRLEARDATGLACGVATDTALVRARARD